MAEFDPNQPFEKVEFDPSQPFESVSRGSGPSQSDSFGRGAAQGATLGFGDEASGGLEAGAGAIESLLRGENAFGDQGRLSGLSNIAQNYARARDTQRGQNKSAEEANPLSYFGGELTGGLAPSTLVGGGSLGAQVLKSGALGAAQGFGSSQGDALDQAKDAGGTGLGAAAATAVLGKAGSTVLNSAGKLKNYFALKSLGPTATEIKNIYATKDVDRLVQRLMDEKIISPLDNLDAIKEKLSKAIQDAGSHLGDFSESVEGTLAGDQDAKDSLAKMVKQAAVGPAGSTDAGTYLGNTKADLLNQLNENVLGNLKRGEKGYGKQISNYLGTELEDLGAQDQLPFSELKDLRSGIGKQIQFAKVGRDPAESAWSKLYGGLSEAEGGMVDRAGQSINTDKARPAYDLLKNRYEDIATADRAASGAFGREQSRMPLGGFANHLTGGALGFAEGYREGGLGKGLLYGGAGLAAGNLVRSRGASTAATAFNAIQSAAERSPQALGKFATVVQNSLARGPQDFAVTHYVLQQTDPSYREMSNSLPKEENQ